MASGGPTPNIDPSIDVHSVPYVNSKLKDLMLTFPTLLIILNRKEEALYILEQCWFICDRYKFSNTKAILTLMIASIFLSIKEKTHEEVWDKAQEALNLFALDKDNEGKAEATFLLGLVLWKKPIHKNFREDPFLQRQNQSQITPDINLDNILQFKKTNSHVETLLEEDQDYLEAAKGYYHNLKHQYHLSRVWLAIAIRKIQMSIDFNKHIELRWAR